MNNIILFDNAKARTNLLPLSYTRPLCELLVGITTIREKWMAMMPGDYSILTEEYLSEKYPAHVADDNIFVASNVIPDQALVERIMRLEPLETLVCGDERIAFRGSLEELNEESMYGAGSVEALKIDYLYDIFTHNDRAIREDFERLGLYGKGGVVAESNTVIGDRDLLYVDETAHVEGCFLNVSKGPIYIGPGAEVMEGSCLRGPIAVCDHSTVNMGSKIYGATTIGPWSKVGGELNNVVILGYSNKAHDGFLGNAVIGQWCNIGAGCVASNLKNDYTEIKLWNYLARRFTRTGLQFCGLMMGDHSKAGINTMFNTATVLGVGVNVYGSGFQRNFLASFSEGSRAGFTDVPLTKFFDTARRVMARRGVELTEVDERIFEHIAEMSHNFKV